MSLNGRLIAPYQHTGVKWLLERERSLLYPGGFLCDEMGLGKTIQLIATILFNPKPRTLILVPKSIVNQWVQEIKRFGPSLSVAAFDGIDRKLEGDQQVIVAPYSVLPKREGKPSSPLIGVSWDRIILDEGHEIRNKKSKTHVACMELKSPIRWVVSGTPIFNSIKDFVALAAFVGIAQNSVQGYATEICDKYLLRRTKQDLALVNKRLELPPCDFQNLELKMHDEEKDLYQTVFTNGQALLKHVVKTGTQALYQMEILEALLRVRQIMTWPELYLDGIEKKTGIVQEKWCGKSKKLETLMELIQTHDSEKTLVFTQFMGEMDEIERRLKALHICTFRIDGSVSKEKREERLSEFKKGPPNSVFIIQIKAGGVGLNLQEATRVYITTPSWNPATELQAIGRAHRTGQTKRVVVRRLIYTGYEELPSVEQSIMQLQGGKAKISAEVLNDTRLETAVPNEINSKMTIQVLKKIFAV